MTVYIIPFLIVAAYSENINTEPECVSFYCKSSDQNFVDETCAWFNQKSYAYYVDPCADNTTACLIEGPNPGNYTCQTAPYPLTPLKWPGESCSKSEDCQPNFCTGCVSGICAGSSEGTQCSNSNSCNPGLYCKNTKGSKVCTAQIPLNGTGCEQDSDCVNSAGCNITSYENLTENRCVQYWSLKTKEYVGTCDENQNQLCKSGWCYSNDANTSYWCSEEFSNEIIIPSPCIPTADYPCKFLIHGLTFTPNCNCGKNEAGYAYCELIPGDYPRMQYESMLKKWISSQAATLCNTVKRFDQSCIIDKWDQKSIDELLYFELYTDYYTDIIGSPDCVAKTFYLDFIKYKKQYDDDIDEKAIIIGFSSLVLAIIY